MSAKVKPLEVSPLIRAGRYIFLFSGFVYGIMKLSAYRAYEITAKPKRLEMYKEQHRLEKIQELKTMRAELRNLTELINSPDIPPGWEEDVV